MRWLKFFKRNIKESASAESETSTQGTGGAKKKKKLKTLGRCEFVNIPSLGLNKISAKIDTGAYRGAIHTSFVSEIEENGKKKLQFKILDEDHLENKDNLYTVEDYYVKKFRGTQVPTHDRYVVPLEVEIAGKTIKADLSLSDRKDLRHPVLIGRRAIKKKFLVDVTKKYKN
jgi:hypothetical protein